MVYRNLDPNYITPLCRFGVDLVIASATSCTTTPQQIHNKSK